MRDRTGWRDELRRELERAWPEPMPLGPAQFLDVELALYLAWNLAPGTGSGVVPALISGYAASSSDGRMARTAIGAARHLVPTFKSPHEWRRALAAYQAVPLRWRAFDVGPGESFTQRTATTLTNRWQVYAAALRSAPAHRRDGIRPAGPGRHTVTTRRVQVTVDIPALGRPALFAPLHTLPGARKRHPLRVTWAQLLETAHWMDATEDAKALKPGHWEPRLKRCRLLVFEPSAGSYQIASELAVDGVFNLAGMVSSGKSTLRDVLAVYAAKAGLRVVIVVGDVASALRSSSHLKALEIDVAPLLGRTNRASHISRWHRLHQEARPELGPLELDDPSFGYLSTGCALDGFREGSEPLPIDDTPCERLVLEGAEQLLACPFLPECPSHDADLAAVGAKVWIGTPASLVYSRPARTINPHRLRYLELAIRNADLVIVDEADAVQAQLDEIFMPSQVLAGSIEDSWLDRLEARVSTELISRTRGQLADRTVSSWLTALRGASGAVNGIYTLLQQEPAVARWLGRGYFQEWSLALRLACDWTGTSAEEPSPSRTSLMDEFELTFKGLRGEQAGNELAAIAIEAMGSVAIERVRERLALWLSGRAILKDEAGLVSGVSRLHLTVLVALLAGNLQYVYRQWNQVESVLGLERAGNSLLQGPPRDYEALIPDGPMGNVFGFQYVLPTESHGVGGKLRSFRCVGMGRFLLLHLPDLLQADECDGPNVALLSATCWAGTSPTHHIGLPVHGLLEHADSEIVAISQSEFTFTPIRNNAGVAITVSGAGDGRDAALTQMIGQLADPSSVDGRCSLADELALLPADRRRCLLVVNSYEQARLVGRELSSRQAWHGRCAVLVPDSDAIQFESDELLAIRRGQISSLASTSADVIVAPLLAIERGHNILNELGQAALGSAYFLVRPHPQPDDISFAVHSINRWAVDHYRQWTSGPIESLDDRSQELRDLARRYWHHLISLPIRYGSLPDREREALTWTQLVATIQVVGRLVRGGVPARVHFCDAAFAPVTAKGKAPDTVKTSLLASFVAILDPYMAGTAGTDRDRSVAEALYRPFFDALVRLLSKDLARV